MRPPPLLALLLLLPPCAARRPPAAGVCAQACRESLLPARFADAAGADRGRAAGACRSQLAVASAYLCFEAECGSAARARAVAALNASCLALGAAPVPPFADAVAGLDARRLRRVARDDVLRPGPPWTEPVLPAPAYFAAWLDTIVRASPSPRGAR